MATTFFTILVVIASIKNRVSFETSITTFSFSILCLVTRGHKVDISESLYKFHTDKQTLHLRTNRLKCLLDVMPSWVPLQKFAPCHFFVFPFEIFSLKTIHQDKKSDRSCFSNMMHCKRSTPFSWTPHR